MSSVFGIAQSGLQVASLRIAVSANNVANVLTDGFVASRVEAQEVAGGGVSGRAVRNDPELEARIDGAVRLSQTDLAGEMVDQMRAAAAFRASLAVLRTADETLGALVKVEA